MGKNVRKSKSYKVHGPENLLGIQDKGKYSRKKRIFNQIFSEAAIRGYEPKVLERVEEFCATMMPKSTATEKDGGWSESKNMSPWCKSSIFSTFRALLLTVLNVGNYLTLDIITSVVFTTTWSLLSSPLNRGVIETSATVVYLIGVIHQSAWLYTYKILILIFFPKRAKSIPALRKYTLSIMAASMEAREKGPELKDAFAQLLQAKDPESKSGEGLAHADVRINSSNLLVAGSDTSSSALAATFFYLSHNVDAYEKVASEVRDAFESSDAIRSGPVLNSCVYLRAAINEAMRLSPVVAQPLWREVESGGAMIAGQKIPAGYNVGAGIFTLHHNADVFNSPYAYNIERWIVQEGKGAEEEKARIKACQRSFAPFSTGPRQCIAKNFAMMELLLTIANVIWRMDFEREGNLGGGGPEMGLGRERKGEFQLKSHFTSHMEGPMIRFRKRNEVDDGN